jgi:cytochrome c551/c552
VAAEDHDFSKMERLLGARPTIVDEIATCSMPPKSPLEDAEANVILRWAACAQSAQ